MFDSLFFWTVVTKRKRNAFIESQFMRWWNLVKSHSLCHPTFMSFPCLIQKRPPVSPICTATNILLPKSHPPLDTPTSASRGIRLLPSTGGKQSLVQTNITTTNITYRSTLNFYCPYFWYPPTPHGPHGSCVLYGICKCFTSFWEFISRTIIAYMFCLLFGTLPKNAA